MTEGHLLACLYNHTPERCVPWLGGYSTINRTAEQQNAAYLGQEGEQCTSGHTILGDLLAGGSQCC